MLIAAAVVGVANAASLPGSTSTLLYGSNHSRERLLAQAEILAAKLDFGKGIFHANQTLWTTKHSSFHLFVTNRTEPCHTHAGTTFAQTLQGTGAFRVPYASADDQLQLPGDSFFIPPMQPHAFGPAAGPGKCTDTRCGGAAKLCCEGSTALQHKDMCVGSVTCDSCCGWIGPGDPVVVTVLWSPPFQPGYTKPAAGCKMS